MAVTQCVYIYFYRSFIYRVSASHTSNSKHVTDSKLVTHYELNGSQFMITVWAVNILFRSN